MFRRNTESRLLYFALELNTCQHIAASEIGRIDVHQHCRISVFARTRISAHTVGNDAALFTGSSHHLPARAHAERVHAAARRQMHRQLVFGGAQGGMLRRLSPLRLVDGLLRVLDANTHRKGLLLHGKTLVAAQLEHVTCRMTTRQHQFSSGNFFASARFHVFQLHGGEFTINEIPPRKARAETHFTATLDHFVAHSAHDTRQVIAAQVRMGVDQDAFGRASVNEPMQHVLCKRILDIGSELTI